MRVGDCRLLILERPADPQSHGNVSRSRGIQRCERSELANTGGFRQQTQYGAEGAVLRHSEETGTAVTLPRGERPGTNTRVFGRYLSVCHLQSARAGKSFGESHETSVLLRAQRDDAAGCSSTFTFHNGLPAPRTIYLAMLLTPLLRVKRATSDKKFANSRRSDNYLG